MQQGETRQDFYEQFLLSINIFFSFKIHFLVPKMGYKEQCRKNRHSVRAEIIQRRKMKTLAIAAVLLVAAFLLVPSEGVECWELCGEWCEFPGNETTCNNECTSQTYAEICETAVVGYDCTCVG